MGNLLSEARENENGQVAIIFKLNLIGVEDDVGNNNPSNWGESKSVYFWITIVTPSFVVINCCGNIGLDLTPETTNIARRFWQLYH